MSSDLTPATVKAPLKESNSTANVPQRNLKSARERLTLSAADIANQLNLTVTLIEKIEINDFSDIAPIFAKGYVRSYAKLVKLSEESTNDIISLINASNKDAETQANLKLPRATRFIKEKKRWPTVLVYCLVIALIPVLIGYWQGMHKPKNIGTAPISDNNLAEISTLSVPDIATTDNISSEDSSTELNTNAPINNNQQEEPKQ